MHVAVYLPHIDEQHLGTYTGPLGLDTASFGQCLSSEAHRSAILAARGAGTRLGVASTPSIAVNGQLVDVSGAQSVDKIVGRLGTAVGAALTAN